VIGTGVNTGLGAVSSFDQIDWGSAPFYLKISVDLSGGSTFSDYGSSQLFSVPYAFYSQKTGGATALRLSELNDVDTSGLAPGKVLKWNGAYWIPSQDNDSDTVSYVYNSGHATTSDTATYVLTGAGADTVLFAYQADTALFAGVSENADNTSAAGHADTALYAFSSPPTAWQRTGNAGLVPSKYIGTNDSTAFVIRSNNTERFSISENGNVAIANPSNTTSFNVLSPDGIVSSGSFGASARTLSGGGDKMIWYLVKGSLRAGYVTGAQWDSVNIGVYGFCTGYNTTTHDYSFTSGNTCLGGDYTIAMGRKSQATALGAYPNGAGVALGDSCRASGQRCVVIGDGNYATAASCVAIGSKNIVGSGVATVLGTHCNGVGTYSTAMGYYASVNTRTGSFVYGDASSTAPTLSSANYQFKVRASGGIIFYTDTALTMGMSLAPGSGAWASVSDVRKKENFSSVDLETTLSKIEHLKITSWNYKSEQRSIRHVGPMAQDFYKTFGYGEGKRTITGVDMDGVILAGIKALDFRIEKLSSLRSIDELKNTVNRLDDMDSLNKRLDVIEAALNKTE